MFLDLTMQTIFGRKPAEVAAWAAALLFLGWLLPSLMGVVYTDPLLHLTYAGLTVLFASPLVADRVYEDPRGIWRHMLAGVRFAMLSFFLMMAIDAVRANRASGGNLWPEAGHVARAALIALGFAVFGSGLSAALATRVTRARTARQILRTGFLVGLAGVIFGLRRMGADTQYELMTMMQPGGGLPMLALVTGTLLTAGAAAAWITARSEGANRL